MLLLLPGRRGGLLVAVVAGMVLLSVCAGAAPRLRARRARGRDRASYLAHLDRLRARLDQVAAAQRQAAELLHPDLPGLLAVAGRRERLWERRPADGDFLSVRVGRGPVGLACPVRLEHGAGGPLAAHDPELLAAAEALVAGAASVADVPVALGLRGLGVLAVTGPPDRARALARSMACQLAAFHAPGDLRILASAGTGGEAAWDWLKWLPHTRRPAQGPGEAFPGSLLAPGPTGLAALLDAEVRPRLERLARAGPGPPGAPGDPGLPHLVVLLDGFSPLAPEARLPVVAELLERAAEVGATVICLAARKADEPAELGARIRLSEAAALELEVAGPGGRRAGGVAPTRAGSPAARSSPGG